MGLPVFNYQELTSEEQDKLPNKKEINTIKGITMLEQMGKQAKDAAFILAQLTTAEKKLCIIHYCRTTRTTSTAYLSRKRKKILNLPNKMDYRMP